MMEVKMFTVLRQYSAIKYSFSKNFNREKECSSENPHIVLQDIERCITSNCYKITTISPVEVLTQKINKTTLSKEYMGEGEGGDHPERERA